MITGMSVIPFIQSAGEEVFATENRTVFDSISAIGLAFNDNAAMELIDAMEEVLEASPLAPLAADFPMTSAIVLAGFLVGVHATVLAAEADLEASDALARSLGLGDGLADLGSPDLDA